MTWKSASSVTKGLLGVVLTAIRLAVVLDTGQCPCRQKLHGL